MEISLEDVAHCTEVIKGGGFLGKNYPAFKNEIRINENTKVNIDSVLYKTNGLSREMHGLRRRPPTEGQQPV